jgi:hypothetical protein
MTSGAPIFRRLVRRRWLGLLECSSLLLGLLDTEVDNTQDDSWRGSFMTLLYLVAKHSHVGVDVDRLAYPLHRPTVHSCQTREQGLRPGIVLSLQQGVTSFGGCEAPRARIFGGELIASVPTIPNLTWGKSLLPGGCLSHGRAIMVFRRVFLVLLLHQAAMGRIQYSSIYCQVHVGSYGNVHSCRAPMVTACRCLGSTMLIRLREAPGCVLPGSLPGSMGEAGWAVRW